MTNVERHLDFEPSLKRFEEVRVIPTRVPQLDC
jgi:hypothetical protein